MREGKEREEEKMNRDGGKGRERNEKGEMGGVLKRVTFCASFTKLSF